MDIKPPQAVPASGHIDLQLLQMLQERVLAKRPVLKTIVDKHGNKNLASYAKDFVDVNLNPPIQHRQNEMIDTFQEQVTEVYGSETALKVSAQLAAHYFVSTADHMGPICHPFFINSNLVTVAGCSENLQSPLEYLIVLSCSSISFDNSSFPRGLQFHSAVDPNNPSLKSFGFFGRNARPSPVFNFRSYNLEDLSRTEKLLMDAVRSKEILEKERDVLMSLFQEVYRRPDVLACTTFSEQMCKTNFELWQRYFRKCKHKVPHLLYLEQETLVSKLLLKYHLDSDTIIWHFLFDPEYYPLIKQYFDGMDFAFSEEEKQGTFLFWALPPGSKYRQQLWRQGNELVTQDGSYRVQLTPHEIRRALEAREIFSSTLMDFIVLSFYYGLKCLGGFNQVNYLTKMKDAYIKMQVDRGNYRSIEVCARAQTKEMCDGFSLAFLGYNDTMTLATGIDFLLYGQEGVLERILSMCKAMTVSEALSPLLPEIYKISYEEHEWEQNLLAIDARTITSLIGLDQKMQPCMRIA